ncbi:carbohydrate ABC transporter permease [uncultured Devosia sp.]|uniref:carbohydrate ABC transporter permease n=1 Tax=uncultured Devosia sp. TaxID=211434 RepID=UPI0035CA5078
MKSTNLALGIAGLAMVLVLIAFPLYWSVRTSLVEPGTAGFVPEAITFKNYQFLFTAGKFWNNIRNSILVSTGSLVLGLPIALAAGYAIARFSFPGKSISTLLLFLPLLPAIAVLIPLILFVRALGLYNTLWPVILANTIFTLPFAIWMIRGFILAIPTEIEEAGRVDGASPLKVLLLIVVPLAAPGLISVGMFMWITSWNNYLFSFAFTVSPDLQIVPAAILGFISAWGVNYGGLNAAAVLASLPPLILFLAFQKLFIQGMLAGSIK